MYMSTIFKIKRRRTLKNNEKKKKNTAQKYSRY